MQVSGGAFLHDLNPKLHISQEVASVVEYLRVCGESVSSRPKDKIAAYLGFLASEYGVNDGILTGDPESVSRQVEAHVIKDEDVPENYFALQRRIARQEGHGDIGFYPALRQRIVGTLQEDQRQSLHAWTDYLTGDAKDLYPNWFKRYVFDSVVVTADYDPDKGSFRTRTKGTTVKYPDLNREALSAVYDEVSLRASALEKRGGSVELTVAEKQALKDNSNFSKRYSKAMEESVNGYPTPEELAITEGTWRLFKQSDNPADADTLADSLQGRGTGWCTSGLATAQMQLSAGDFYIYFTKDRLGADKVPRVAIRMEGDEVAEVRGIVGGGENQGAGVNTNQELEPSMLNITTEKLQDLKGGESYMQKAHDMGLLTAIEHKVKSDPLAPLSREELIVLYQIDHEVQGFGYQKRDPRIREIRNQRGEVDAAALTPILREAIRAQLDSSRQGFREVQAQLDGWFSRNKEVALHDLEQLFIAKDQEWQEGGVYEYLTEQLIKNQALFTLLISPNQHVKERKLINAAKSFAEKVGLSNAVDSELLGKGYFDAKRVNDGSSVKFCLISDQTVMEAEGTIDSYQQLAILRKAQAENPRLKSRIPDLLETITFWHVLHIQGKDIDRDGDVYLPFTAFIEHLPQTGDKVLAVHSLHNNTLKIYDEGAEKLGYGQGLILG